MANSGSPELLKYHGLVRDIEESMHDYVAVSSWYVEQVIRKLCAVRTHFDAKGNGEIPSVCDAVKDGLSRVSQSTCCLSSCERQMLIEACEELRLHIIASALSSVAYDKAPDSRKASIIDYIQNENIGSTRGLIVQGYGGVTHGLVGTTRVIIIPRVANQEGCEVLYDELVNIFERKNGDESWVIDLSLVTELPWQLLANLLAFTSKLRKTGDDFHLCWIRQDLLTEKQLVKVRKIFDLQLMAGYYFSRGEAPT